MSIAVSGPPPRPFVSLGVAGLVPFVAAAAACLVGPENVATWALHLFLGYAAVILTFVGALHFAAGFGAAQADAGEAWAMAGWSVVPALIAWVTLSLPAQPALMLLAGGFVAQLAMDRRLARRVAVPGWFLPMRVALSVVVLACIGAVLAAFALRG